MADKIVAYGMLDDEKQGAVFFHFAADGFIYVKYGTESPSATYEVYTGTPTVLDFLHIVDEERFLEMFGAWDD